MKTRASIKKERIVKGFIKDVELIQDMLKRGEISVSGAERLRQEALLKVV